MIHLAVAYLLRTLDIYRFSPGTLEGDLD